MALLVTKKRKMSFQLIMVLHGQSIENELNMIKTSKYDHHEEQEKKRKFDHHESQKRI
jgi:hypothetical protein